MHFFSVDNLQTETLSASCTDPMFTYGAGQDNGGQHFHMEMGRIEVGPLFCSNSETLLGGHCQGPQHAAPSSSLATSEVDIGDHAIPGGRETLTAVCPGTTGDATLVLSQKQSKP